MEIWVYTRNEIEAEWVTVGTDINYSLISIDLKTARSKVATAQVKANEALDATHEVNTVISNMNGELETYRQATVRVEALISVQNAADQLKQVSQQTNSTFQKAVKPSEDQEALRFGWQQHND